MISALTNYRPFFSSFFIIYLLPSRESFVKLANEYAHTVMAHSAFIYSKIGAKSFGDGSQDICKYKESNLGPVAGFYGSNYPEKSFFRLVRVVEHAMKFNTVLN